MLRRLIRKLKRGRPRTGLLKNVLVVDDAPRSRERLSGLLKAKGLRVRELPNGAEVPALCRERIFDAVFLDLVMPFGPGSDLGLSVLDADPATPVVLCANPLGESLSIGVERDAEGMRFVGEEEGPPDLNAAVVESHIEDFMNQGGFAWLSKPFQSSDVDTLVLQIKQHLAERWGGA